jgi:hypothetical protein
MYVHPHAGRGTLRLANDALAFLLELVALVALGYWGFRTGDGTPAKVALAVGAPLAAAVVWGLFAAPRATFKVPLAGVVAVKVLVFGAATAAFFATGHPVLGTVFAIVVVANTTVVTLGRRMDRDGGYLDGAGSQES